MVFRSSNETARETIIVIRSELDPIVQPQPLHFPSLAFEKEGDPRLLIDSEATVSEVALFLTNQFV